MQDVASDAEVTWEDQKNIDKFGKLNNRFHELQDNIKIDKGSPQEFDNLDSLLLVPRDKWDNATRLHISNHCKLKIIPTIRTALKVAGEEGKFRGTCFGHLIDISIDGHFPSTIFHNLMLRRIKEPGALPDDIYFAIGKTKAKLSGREFALTMGLKMGKLNPIHESFPKMVPGGIQERYWPWPAVPNVYYENIKAKLKARSKSGSDNIGMHDDDVLKMSLLVFAWYILCGKDPHRPIQQWMFVLVEDLPKWNDFNWGHYIWSMTRQYIQHSFKYEAKAMDDGTQIISYHLYGFPWAVMFWAMETIPSIRFFVGSRRSVTTLPRYLRWAMSQSKITDVSQKLIRMEQDGEFKAIEMCVSAEEAKQDYYVNIDAPLSCGSFLPDKKANRNPKRPSQEATHPEKGMDFEKAASPKKKVKTTVEPTEEHTPRPSVLPTPVQTTQSPGPSTPSPTLHHRHHSWSKDVDSIQTMLDNMKNQIVVRIDASERMVKGRLDDAERRMNLHIDESERRVNGHIDDAERRMNLHFDESEKRVIVRIEEAERKRQGDILRLEALVRKLQEPPSVASPVGDGEWEDSDGSPSSHSGDRSHHSVDHAEDLGAAIVSCRRTLDPLLKETNENVEDGRNFW